MSETAEQQSAPTISPELAQKIQALRALATTHNLLDKALLPHSSMEAVRMSLDFLRTLHEQVQAEAIAHPDAHLVPELQALKGAE